MVVLQAVVEIDPRSEGVWAKVSAPEDRWIVLDGQTSDDDVARAIAAIAHYEQIPISDMEKRKSGTHEKRDTHTF